MSIRTENWLRIYLQFLNAMYQVKCKLPWDHYFLCSSLVVNQNVMLYTIHGFCGHLHFSPKTTSG